VVLYVADRAAPGRSRVAPPAAAIGPHGDALLFLLGALHTLNAVGLAFAVHRGLRPADTAIAALLVGLGSAYAAGIVGHELVHRRSRAARLAARLLLSLVFYDHFHVEHVRGHHRRVGTPEDPTTARFGETFGAYAARSTSGQLVSAWRLDRAAVAAGVAFELALVGAIAVGFGTTAVLAWLLQAAFATGLITAVNYFDHWGLVRRGRAVGPSDAWDAAGAPSHYFLLGLPRHADHHVHAVRPYHQLAPVEASPKLPYGYVAMVFVVVFRNAHSRALLAAELARKHLGPFGEPRLTLPTPASTAATGSGPTSPGAP
jgi:alkane 1-monooxygenase